MISVSECQRMRPDQVYSGPQLNHICEVARATEQARQTNPDLQQAIISRQSVASRRLLVIDRRQPWKQSPKRGGFCGLLRRLCLDRANTQYRICLLAAYV